MLVRRDISQSAVRDPKLRRGFTLVELLIVIGIIVVLIALLLPTIGMVRSRARTTQCQNNLRQVSVAYKAAKENRPKPVTPDGWPAEVLPFISGDEEGVLFCPDDIDRDEASSFGMNHRASRLGPKDPLGIEFLDFHDVTARIVGRTIEQLNAEWPAGYAARHTGQVNVAQHDGSVTSIYPDDIDPRYCEHYRKYWWPFRDIGMDLEGCLALAVSGGLGGGTSGGGTSDGTTNGGSSGGGGTDGGTGGTSGSGDGSTDGGSDGGGSDGNTDSGGGSTDGEDPPECTGTTGDLLAHWSFDNAADLGEDVTGNGYDGDLYGGASYNDPDRGQVIQLDGVDDFVESLNPIDIRGSCYSFAAWFKNTGGSGLQDILSCHLGPDHGGLLEIQPSGIMRFLHRVPIATGGGTNLYSPATYRDGQWHHVAGVKDGQDVRLYMDGVEIAQSFDGSTFPVTFITKIGRLKDGNGRWFRGYIDDVRIYGRTLSSDEVAGLAGN